MLLNMTGGAPGGLPKFAYTGTYQLIDDGKTNGRQNWRIKLLSSGVLTFARDPGMLDLFMVGGGGGSVQGSGGGGGYTLNTVIRPEKKTEYQVIVGAGGPSGFSSRTGGSSSAFGYTANGGEGSKTSSTYSKSGGDGGSGGGAYQSKGGSDGSDGGKTDNSALGGKGQGSTTREFGEPDGDLYAGGGSGETVSVGGEGGGGGKGAPGTPNTGGGAGGGGAGREGGSGIVILRDHRG